MSSFAGRDLFAPLAAALASGRKHPHELGPVTTDVVPSVLPEPEVDAKHVKGTILAIDPFGNLISNIGRELVERFERPEVSVGGQTFALRGSYAAIPPGDYGALINSFDTLEIARSQQSETVTVGDFFFCDKSGDGACETTVAAGEAVIWDYREGSAGHTVTFCGASCEEPVDSPLFDSGNLLAGGTFSFLFD